MATCEDCGLPGAERRAGDADGPRCDPCAELVHGEPPARVSPLREGDLELLLAWRSNPEIYRHFRRQDGPLDWEEHVDWFDSRGADRHDFVVRFHGRRVGVVSLDEERHVGVYLGDVSARGRGVATAALEWLCERFEDRAPLYAEVHEENDASRRLFERCGFERHDRDGEWLRYVYES